MTVPLPAMPVMNHAGSTLNFDQIRKASFPPNGPAGGALAGKYPNPTLAPPEAWKAASTLGFEHEWVAFETVPEYRKNPFGVVELRGELKAGKSGESAFILPVGYRPKEKKLFITYSNNATGLVQVLTTGAVAPTNLAVEVKVFIYLDGISFSVE